MTRYIYRDLQFDPIRIRFGEAHGFRADESVAAFMGRLGRFAAAAKIDPTRLTMVTSEVSLKVEMKLFMMPGTTIASACGSMDSSTSDSTVDI